MKKALIVCGAVGVTVAVAAVSALAYSSYRSRKNTEYIHFESEWQMPTENTDFSISESIPEEPETNDTSATITADTMTFTVDNSMLESYEAFSNNDYLQSKVADFLFDIEPNYIADTYTFDGTVMSVMIDADPEDVTLYIDKGLGSIYME